MKIFISWSKELSKQVAYILKKWIPRIIQTVREEDIFVSDQDVNAGVQWDNVIFDKLDNSNLGIVCVTRENINSPWMLFESGYMVCHNHRKNVVPVLIGLSNHAIQDSPLAHFQTITTERNGMEKMISAINKSQPIEIQVADEVVARSFNSNWNELNSELCSIKKQNAIVDTDGDNATNKENEAYELDKESMITLFSHFSVNIVNNFLFGNDPTYIDRRIFGIRDAWDYYFHATGDFVIYDNSTQKAIETFYLPFDALVTKCAYCYKTVSSNPQLAHIQGLEFDVFTSNKAEKDFDEVVKMTIELQPLYKEMIKFVRLKYKLDFDALSKKFEANNSYEK